MADIEHIDLDDKRFEDTSKALREYAASLKRKLAKAEAEASTYRRQLAAKVLGDVVEPFANPDRVKQALLADDVDPLDGTAVRAWLVENGADYAQTATVPEEPSEAQVIQFDPEQDQLERWLEATGQGVWPAQPKEEANER